MTKKPEEIINELANRHASLREFARSIGEDGTDVMNWRNGKRKVRPRAVIKICELYPEYKPHDLNPDIFPANLTLNFGEPNE